MKFLPLTILSILCFALFVGLSSCEKDEGQNKDQVYNKSDLPVTGAQVAPVPSPSAATGKLMVSYDESTQVLSYTVTWSGLSDSVIAIRINGPSPAGYMAADPSFTGANPTAFTTTPYAVIQQFTGTAPKALYPSTGSFSSTLLMDGYKAKEVDLLNGTYYVTIHTKTFTTAPPYTAPNSFLYRWWGEVRAQIIF